MTPEQYCESKVAISGSSFYYSFLFLPPSKRAAMMALYAFCREVDDIVDQTHEPTLALTQLNWWREELARLFKNEAQHPISKALAPHLKTYNLRQEWFYAILDGMQMDLEWGRYLNFEQLKKYCYRVAGVVGLLSASIFEYQHTETLTYAEKLGEALQLINIIRDVGEDAQKGRIYLPIDELQRFAVPAEHILNRQSSDNFTQLMRFQAKRARALCHEALALLPQQDRRHQRAGLIMATTYLALLDEIESENMQVLHQRISLTPLRKLWLSCKTWVRN